MVPWGPMGPWLSRKVVGEREQSRNAHIYIYIYIFVFLRFKQNLLCWQTILHKAASTCTRLKMVAHSVAAVAATQAVKVGALLDFASDSRMIQ